MVSGDHGHIDVILPQTYMICFHKLLIYYASIHDLKQIVVAFFTKWY